MQNILVLLNVDQNDVAASVGLTVEAYAREMYRPA